MNYFFFDEIVVTDPHTMRALYRVLNQTNHDDGAEKNYQHISEKIAQETANFDFLMNRECLVDSKNYGYDFSMENASLALDLADAELGDLYRSFYEKSRKLIAGPHQEWVQSFQKLVKSRSVFAQYFAAYVAEQLRAKNINAISLSKIFDQEDVADTVPNEVDRRLTVSKVMLEKVPVPSDEVTFERILEFRADDEAKGYIFGLRHWMNKASKLDKTSAELSDELDWLKYKHAERLAKHKIETQYSVLCSVFINTLEIAERVVKLQWGEAAKGAVSLFGKRQKHLGFDVDPEAGELNFLIQTEQEFGNKF